MQLFSADAKMSFEKLKKKIFEPQNKKKIP